MANGNISYPQATPNGHPASPREIAANGTRPQIVRQAPSLPNLVTSGPAMEPPPGLSASSKAADDGNSSNGSSTPRERPSVPNDSPRKRGHATTKRRNSANSSPIGSSPPSLSSTGLTSSIASQAVPPSLPHIHLSTSHPKPEALKELINHLTSPPLTSTPSEDTCMLVKQWRLSQYRDVREREHHFGPLLGWPSEYAMGATSEFHMDKALHAAFAPQDPKLDRLVFLHPVRPTFTYGFTSTAFTAPQKALTIGMLDSAKVMPAGEDPLFPFLAQKWINDSDSRREAEREMARAGATMCRALWTFHLEVCKWEEIEADDTLTFTMVVSPEVCRLFVNWIEKSRSEDRPRFYKDLVYAAFMEDAMQVHRMRTICDRIKDWMRDLRLTNLKDALDIMIDANATNGLTTNESTTNGSIKNGLTTNEPMTNAPITDGPSTNGSKPSEEVNTRPAERQRSNSMTHKQRLEAKQAEWRERIKLEAELQTRAELTEEQKTDKELSAKLAIQLQREEEARAEREKRQSIKAGKAGVNPDQGNNLLDASWRRTEPERPAVERKRAGSTETVIWRGDDAEEQTGSEDPEPSP